MTLSARLVTQPIGQDFLTIVDACPSFTWYCRAGQAPTLSFSWVKEAARDPGMLDSPVDVSIQLATDGENWFTPRDDRFTAGRTTWQRLADPSGTRRLEMSGLLSRLDGATVSAASGVVNEDGKRKFTSVTPGALVATLVQEAKGRGVIPWLEVGFTPEKDSNGQPWPYVYSRAYEDGIKLDNVLQGLWEAGAIDFWMQGRTLHLAPPRGRDLTVGDNPVWIRDQTLADSPETEDWRQLTSRVVVIGDEGKRWTFTNSAAATPWGVREQTISAGGVTDEGTAKMMADRVLLSGESVQRTYTREWVETEATPWMPGRDIFPGDWIFVDTAQGHRQRMRVADMSLRRENGSGPLIAFITVGTVNDDLLSRLAKRQLGIEGGAGIISGGKPTPPPTHKGGIPAAPQDLLLDASAYIDGDGKPQGAVTASWQPVTTTPDGVAISVNRYWVWWRPNLADGVWRLAAETARTTATFSPVQVDTEIVVKVQAISEENRVGRFSTAKIIKIPTDVTAPNVPSVPLLSSGFGTVRVVWDGANSEQGGMPADFDHIEVAVGVSDEPPVVGVLREAGMMVQVAQPGTIIWARFRAVDSSKNISEWSQLASIRVRSVLDDDILEQARKDGSFYFPGSVPGASLIAKSVLSEHLAAGSVTSDIVSAGAVKAYHVELGSIGPDQLTGGVNQDLNSANEWAKRTILEPGKITITDNKESPTSIQLTPERESFIVQGKEVAYIDGPAEEMGISAARIKRLRIGAHIVETYNRELTLFRWVGDEA